MPAANIVVIEDYGSDTRRSYAKQVFMVLLPVTFIYMSVTLVVFIKNRHKQPIKARRLKFIVTALVAMIVYISEAGFSYIMLDDHSCVFVLTFGLPMLVICFNLFIARYGYSNT